MKHKIALAALLAIGIQMTASAEVMSWAQGADLTTVNSTNTVLGWTIELYQAVDARQAGWADAVRVNADGTIDIVNSMLGTANDLFISGQATVLAEPFGPGYIAPPLGAEATVTPGSYYGVLYNAADIASASHFVVLDTTPVVVSTGDGTVGPAAVYAVGLSGSGAQWHAIPEPGTIGLMGLAGIGMVLARRKSRK